MNYREIALFTDLDGTLFNSNCEVSAENIAAIHKFIAGGGAFGISTGRAPSNAATMLLGVEINAWSVVLNGSGAYHFAKGISSTQKNLPKEKMEDLIRWVLCNLPEVNIQLCTDQKLFLLSDVDYNDEDFVSIHQPMNNVCLDDVLPLPWLKVLFCAPRITLEKLKHYADNIGLPSVTDSVYTNEVYLEYLPQNVNKGTCLGELRKESDMKGRKFIAIGDYTNDVELLQEADYAIAVANALPEVKAVADYIVCSNDDHALADLIYNVIPKL